ncbi:MAG: nuclear transport factor 2 family protein [Thermoleophilia bacterium]|jgi:ketosteroid isomerase-like protein|nr:nuclear transport factor 2 family protein [Thermoleophilia bacterium]
MRSARLALVVPLALVLPLVLAVAAVAACGCGEETDTEGQGQGASSPTATVAPSPSATETSTQFGTTRWECGTDGLKETRAVLREYQAAVRERAVSPRVAEFYAPEFTLDAWLDRTRVDDLMTAKYIWGMWESNLYWSPAARTYVAPGVAVIAGAVMDDPDDPTMVVPYVDMLAVSDGRITHEEIIGDPHETGVVTKGWKATTAAAEADDTAKEARAAADTVREVLSRTGDFAALEKVYDPDIVFLDTSTDGPLRGVDAVLAWHEGTTRITDIESLAIEPPIAGPGWAVLRTRTGGTIDMDAFSVPGAIVMDVRDGKVVQMRVYYDSTIIDLSP